jgi:hypothetical protein
MHPWPQHLPLPLPHHANLTLNPPSPVQCPPQLMKRPSGSQRISPLALFVFSLPCCVQAIPDSTMEAAGMASKVLEHPFDLTKVRLQSQVLDNAPRYKGPIDCLANTWKHEGFRGLYRVSWGRNFLFFNTVILIVFARASLRLFSVQCARMHRSSSFTTSSNLPFDGQAGFDQMSLWVLDTLPLRQPGRARL